MSTVVEMMSDTAVRTYNARHIAKVELLVESPTSVTIMWPSGGYETISFNLPDEAKIFRTAIADAMRAVA
jgi:hypothetical protein